MWAPNHSWAADNHSAQVLRFPPLRTSVGAVFNSLSVGKCADYVLLNSDLCFIGITVDSADQGNLYAEGGHPQSFEAQTT